MAYEKHILVFEIILGGLNFARFAIEGITMKYVFLLDGALVKKKLHCLIFLFAKGFVVSKTIFKGIINFLMQLKGPVDFDPGWVSIDGKCLNG